MPAYTHNLDDNSRTVKAREEVHDIIENIDPVETKVLTMIRHKECGDIEVKHLNDTNASANKNNALIQGQDAPPAVDTKRTQTSNYVQLSGKTIAVTTTQEVVKQYGIESEEDYQIIKKGAESKTDVEAAILSSNTKVEPIAETQAGKMDGMATIITTNTSNHNYSLGGDKGRVKFLELLQQTWKAGGRPKDCFLGGEQKIKVDDWTTRTASQNTSVYDAFGRVDRYLTSFGDIRFHVHWLIPSTHAFILDLSKWQYRMLHNWRTEKLAQTGLAYRKILYIEGTLQCLSQKANAMFNNLTTTDET